MSTTRTAISAIAIAALLGVCGRAGAGTISGNVSEAGTGVPISTGFVIIYNADGTYQAHAFFDSNGNFSKDGLVAGTYFARTSRTNHVDELWDNIPCANNGDCTVTSGSPISVDSSSTAVVNFVLDKGGTISGTLTETTTGLPISVGGVRIFNGAASMSLGDAIPDSNGHYSMSGLLAGSYFARTVDTNHIDELWDNIPCANGCAVASGTPISVTSSGTTTANFVLETGGTIAGTLTDSTTALPISGGIVSIYNDAGLPQGYVFSNIDGSYSKGGLVAGSYFARTSNTNHIDELWNDIPCVQGSCSVLDGTPITVTATSTATANFVLDKGGTISGTLTDYASGTPISSGFINIYNAGGTYIGKVLPDVNGRFARGGLLAGSYFARTVNTNRLDELWNNIPCANGACVVTNGTPITLSGNQTAIVNFQLANDLDGLFKNGFD